ncbi:hypothetical protein REPUB_Repub12eG0120200 [Reevesia pubescens]
MERMEGEGSSEMELTEIETSTEFLDTSVIFHVVNDAIIFVLYMHQQIPSILHDISLEFDSMHTEYKELEMNLGTKTEVKAYLRRKHIGRMREVKQGIRRMEKFMSKVSSLQTELQLMITEIPNIQEPKGFRGRALISKGAGSSSYPGPTKLFLMVKTPTSFNLPLHFLPKRDFRYSKKIVPFRLRFRCRTQGLEFGASEHGLLSSRSTGLINSSSNDLIWFQCRHAIKGIAFRTPEEE